MHSNRTRMRHNVHIWFFFLFQVHECLRQIRHKLIGIPRGWLLPHCSYAIFTPHSDTALEGSDFISFFKLKENCQLNVPIRNLSPPVEPIYPGMTFVETLNNINYSISWKKSAIQCIISSPWGSKQKQTKFLSKSAYKNVHIFLSCNGNADNLLLGALYSVAHIWQTFLFVLAHGFLYL